MTTETKSLRDTAMEMSNGRVSAMSRKINESIERRHAFETNDGESAAGASWKTSKAKIEGNLTAVSRLMLALNVEPANIIERRLVEGKMFNAKSLMKVVELAAYVTGASKKLQTVTQAFIACALLASVGKDEVVFTNDMNRRFLNSSDLSRAISDADLLEALNDRRHKSMTTGDKTQSSQMRNVLDALGLGEIRKVDRARDAVVVNKDHALFDMFRSDFMTA